MAISCYKFILPNQVITNNTEIRSAKLWILKQSARKETTRINVYYKNNDASVPIIRNLYNRPSDCKSKLQGKYNKLYLIQKPSNLGKNRNFYLHCSKPQSDL